MGVPDLKDAFLKKHPNYPKIVWFYEQANGCELSWEGLTKSKLMDFVGYMLENVAQSSARRYAAMLKAVMNKYSDVIDLPRGWEDILSVKKDVSQHVYLDADEINRVIEYVPKSEVEKTAKESFLLGLLTGSRYSDYTNFTMDNIQDGYLVYISQKTHVEARVPICPAIIRILEEKQLNGWKEMSEPTFNDNIRHICKASGVNKNIKLYHRGKYKVQEKWQYIASHSARRSFATNLYLLGVDLYSISKMMGHTSVTMTEGYICCGLRTLSPKVMEYFNSFK